MLVEAMIGKQVHKSSESVVSRISHLEEEVIRYWVSTELCEGTQNEKILNEVVDAKYAQTTFGLIACLRRG